VARGNGSAKAHTAHGPKVFLDPSKHAFSKPHARRLSMTQARAECVVCAPSAALPAILAGIGRFSTRERDTWGGAAAKLLDHTPAGKRGDQRLSIDNRFAHRCRHHRPCRGVWAISGGAGGRAGKSDRVVFAGRGAGQPPRGRRFQAHARAPDARTAGAAISDCQGAKSGAVHLPTEATLCRIRRVRRALRTEAVAGELVRKIAGRNRGVHGSSGCWAKK